jgi:hypothetical protein
MLSNVKGVNCIPPTLSVTVTSLAAIRLVVPRDSPHRHAASGDAGIFGLVPIASALLQSRPSLCGPLSLYPATDGTTTSLPNVAASGQHAIFPRSPLHHLNSLL